MEPGNLKEESKANPLQKAWDSFRNFTQTHVEDHWSVKLLKLFLQIVGISVLIILSPVIILVLLFAFLLSL
ncbi:MAG: hypothetical protein WD334_04405 [Chitinophagales bacterium]